MSLTRMLITLQFVWLKFRKSLSWLSIYTSLAMLNITKAYAIGELLKSKDAKDLTIGVYGLGAIISTILVVLVWQLISSKSKVKSSNRQLEEYEQIKFNALVGILKVSEEGKILSVSSSGTRLLGRMENKLIGQNIITCFSDDHHEQVSSLLTAKESSITAKAKASNMFLQMDISELVTLQSKHVYILTLTDINQTFKQKSSATQLLAQNNKTLEVLNVGQLWFDLNNDEFVYDKRCAQLALFPTDYFDNKKPTDISAEQPIRWFNEHIHPSDLNNWTKALHNAASDGSSEVSIRIQTSQDSESHTFLALYAFLVAVETQDAKKVQMCVLKNHWLISLRLE